MTRLLHPSQNPGACFGKTYLASSKGCWVRGLRGTCEHLRSCLNKYFACRAKKRMPRPIVRPAHRISIHLLGRDSPAVWVLGGSQQAQENLCSKNLNFAAVSIKEHVRHFKKAATTKARQLESSLPIFEIHCRAHVKLHRM